jgi:hypothetical protein
VHGEERRHQREAAADDDGTHIVLSGALPGDGDRQCCRGERAEADSVEVHPERRHHVVLSNEREGGDGQPAAHDDHRHDQAERPPYGSCIGRHAPALDQCKLTLT